MVQISKEIAQEHLNSLANDLREKRAVFITDSRSANYTAVFNIISVNPNGSMFEYKALMNYLGFKPSFKHGNQIANICQTQGGYSWYTMVKVGKKAAEMGLEVPTDWTDIIQRIHKA